MTEGQALLVLNAVENLGAMRIRKLRSFFGNALKVLQVSEVELALSGLVSEEMAHNIFHFSKDKFLGIEYNLIQHKGLEVLTCVDERFPKSLGSFEDAPVVLYIKGDWSSLNQESVAIVGSRAASFYGCKSAKAFASSFAKAGLVVVSGLARGIDTAAHQGALEADGKTVAVIGCGFNYMYPKENFRLMEEISKHGAVVTEYACTMPPLKQNFPWRNRIISGLSRATVVIEAGKRSGALITTDYALAQNKDVYVLPSNIDSDTAIGSNQLLAEGALLALNPDDVLMQLKHDYMPEACQEHKPMLLLSDEQLKVYPFISHEPVHVDELARASGLSIGSLMNITLSLELKRVIRQLPGQYYVRMENA